MAMEREIATKAADFLKQPYARVVVPETDGTYRGEILEFPGCIATGDTPAEALSNLDEVAECWLESELQRGHVIPKPIEDNDYSGRLVLRMPKALHRKAARIAEREGVSLNQFITTALAEHVGERSGATIVSGSPSGHGAYIFHEYRHGLNFAPQRVVHVFGDATNVKVDRVPLMRTFLNAPVHEQ